MKIIRTATVILAVTSGLLLAPASARAQENDRDSRMDSSREAGREYLRNEVNPLAEPSTYRGEPVIRGDGEVMMPGEEAPRQIQPLPFPEEEVKVKYVYDKSADGLFPDDIMPKRLFNNVNP